MGTILSQVFEAVCRSMMADAGSERVRGPTLAEAMQQALEDWRAAEQILDYVTDPDLIDQAIYTIEASRKRYSYLLNRLREGRSPESRAY